MHPNYIRLRNDLAAYVKEYALEVKKEGEPPFVLKSGATSNFYLDCRRLTLTDRSLYVAVSCVLRHPALDHLPHDIDAMGGPSVGADPIVGGLIYAVGKHGGHGDTRGFLVRPSSKDHGKDGLVIGSVKKGDKCLVVEDVTTTGGSLLAAVDAVEKERGAVVKVAFALIDRSDGKADEAFAARGIPFYPILTLKDLGLEQP